MDVNDAYRLVVAKLTRWLNELVRLIPNILLAAVILVIGIFVARYVRKVALNLFKKMIHNKTIHSLLASIVYFTFLGIIIFTVLSILQLDKAVTSILAGAGLLGLALAFAFQDIAANFISGIIMSLRKPMKVGDVVLVQSYMGKVEEINLRDTVIRTFQGQMVIIPNKEIFQNAIENFSMLGKRRSDIVIGVSYGDDLRKVKEIALAAVGDLEHLSPDDPTTLYFGEFGDSSINFTIRIWIKSPEQKAFIEATSEAIIRIKEAFDKNDIMIPFPIRTLDFGIKGGVTLKEAMTPSIPPPSEG